MNINEVYEEEARVIRRERERWLDITKEDWRIARHEIPQELTEPIDHLPPEPFIPTDRSSFKYLAWPKPEDMV